MMHKNRKIFSRAILPLALLFLTETAAQGAVENEYLDMNISQLMQITITSATRKPQQLSETAAAVFVITQDDIHRSGVTSIPEALRLAPGLQVARIDAGKWAVTSRGFSGNFANKLLVMIDGRTVYSPAFSGVYWDAQNTLLDDVDRIEVIRGPGATVWGANAVNGVINIITKKADATLGGLVYLGGGNQEPFMGGVRYGTALGEATYGRAYLTYHSQDSFVLHQTGADAGDDWDRLGGGFRMDGQRGTDTWTLQGDVYSNRENQTLDPYWLPHLPYRSVKVDDVDASGWNILGRWRKDFTDTDILSLQAYYDYTDRDEAIMDQSHGTFDLDLQYQTRIGERNSLTMGLGYRRINSDFANTFQVSLNPDNRSDELYSGFLQDEIALLADRLMLTLGVKWEHNDFTGNEIQPTGRLLWKISEGQSGWAAISRAVRTPSQFEKDGTITIAVDPTSPPYPMLYTLNGTDRFESEELLAYELGYRWLPTARFSLDLALFYNDYDSLLTADPGSPTSFNTLYLNNKLYGSTYGLELASDWQVHEKIKLEFSYTYIGFDLQPEDDKVTEGTSPKHQLSLLSEINIRHNLQCNFWLRYVSALDTSKEILSSGVEGTPDYLTMDANISWHPMENLELMLVGQNLFNASHQEYISEFSTPATEIERSVYGKVTLTF